MQPLVQIARLHVKDTVQYSDCNVILKANKEISISKSGANTTQTYILMNGFRDNPAL